MTGRMDTDLHIVPPRYAAWLVERGGTNGGLPIPPWSYDTARASSPFGKPALANPDRITFGTDWPGAPRDRGLMFTRMLDEFPMTDDLRRAVDTDNAATLFPRFAGVGVPA